MPNNLNFKIVKKGVVLPPNGNGASPLGGVCTANYKYIQNSCPNLGAGGLYIPNSIKIEDTKVIYIGWINQVWGHLITDSIKKIWFLKSQEYKSYKEQGYQMVYISHCKVMPDYTKRFLKFAGLEISDAIQIFNPTQFEEIVIPDDCFVSYGQNPHYTIEYTRLINHIKSQINLDLKTYEKIYFTRTQITPKFKWRTMWMPKEVGEKEIENAFAKCGYKIIEPEKITFEEQIHYLTHCSEFAATEGSISHNSIFCEKNTKVCIIKKENKINIYTTLTNQAADTQTNVISCNASFNVKSTYYGPFYLCVTKDLENYLGRRFPHKPYWAQPLWFWYMTHNTFIGRGLQYLLRKI